MNGIAPVSDQTTELDNHLTLSPGDYPEIKKWEDGKRYRVTLEIGQDSVGEFAVDKMVNSNEIGDESEPAESDNPAEEGGEQYSESASPNPAVRKLMQGMKQ